MEVEIQEEVHGHIRAGAEIRVPISDLRSLITRRRFAIVFTRFRMNSTYSGSIRYVSCGDTEQAHLQV
jgi:hypothetical protein